MPQYWRKATERFVMVAALLIACIQPTAASQLQRKVLVMGDSLSAAYNIPAEQGWVALLEQRLHPYGWSLVNASISGETTAGGASRIAHALQQHRPGLVVIELGANDGLRGLPIEHAQANLERMIEASQATGSEVVLIGMRIPPNYGPDYTAQFEAMFRSIASEHGIALLPFLLEPIAREPEAFQPDQLHPTAAVQPRLADHVWSALQPLLDRQGVPHATP